MSAPGQHSVAHVRVITRSHGVWMSIVGWLADDATTVACSDDLAGLLAAERPDVIAVDRQLFADVATVLRRVRRRWPTVSIILVCAADEVDVAGLLDAGADDAVVIDSPTLAARLHAATRRARTMNAGTRIVIGDIVYDRESRRVWCAGAEVALTPTEESVLDCLFWYSPRAVDFRTLIAHVWGEELTPGHQRLTRVYIGYLRSKLAASRSVWIRTLRGVGYALAQR